MTTARFLRAAIVTAFAIATPVAAAPAPKPVVEGYLPSIRGMEATLAATDITPYTAVALSFINPDTNGSIVNGDGMACMTDRMGAPIPTQTLRNAVDTLHRKGHKAIGALAGALLPICAGSWSDLTTPAKRAATVAALVDFAEGL